MKNRRKGVVFWIPFILAFIGGLVLAQFIFSSHYEPLQTHPNVDVEKYMGTWYSIQEIPNWFQRNCECTTAQYFLNEDGSVNVFNKCNNNNQSITGKAFVVNETSNSELKVQFGWFRNGDYNILYVDNNYNYALVGTQDRDYLWLLSREPSMSDHQIEIMQTIAQEQDFDISRLKSVNQGCFLEGGMS